MSVQPQLGAVFLTVVIAACASAGTPPRAAPRALPPDSAALLSAGIALARPAYATQEQALASSLYARHATTPRPGRAASEDRVLPSRTGEYVIQVAAFFDPAVAESAADLARRRFPELEVLIEETADLLRLAVGPWSSRGAAQGMLPTVRSHYPDAWVRMRASP